jgi:hypothetical protein
MSGLKINFAKSEAFVIEADEEDQRRAAFMLNCKLGKLPMTYLGLPIDAMKLPIAAFQPLMQRVAKKVDPWLGMNSSNGGRGILIESCLSSLPLYSMSFYLLQDGIHSSFDKARSRLFWAKGKDKQKYHMVKWVTMCTPKDVGGLGFTNTKLMNAYLMAKWAWKVYNGQGGLMAPVDI